MLSWIKDIYSWNYLLAVPFTAWISAQIIKTILNFVLVGNLNLERMWGAGGMPSAHSATVCSLIVASGRLLGTNSPIFALSVILAAIVMYDAMGVRRETGEQAKILNQLLTDWMDEESKRNPIFADKQLKEMVGHTPFEVLGGAVWGVVVGLVIPVM